MPDELNEVPEADALDQRREVIADDEVLEPPVLALETPEADALEQAQSVSGDDDELRS